MCFYYLLFGHLLGDFTLQTNKIAENKGSNWKWNLLHTVIVTSCMFLFSIPFGLLIMGLVLISGVLHYWIDYYKSRLAIKNFLWMLVYFTVDQALHIYIIYLISTFAGNGSAILPFNENIIKFLIIITFTLSFSRILVQYLLKIIFPGYNQDLFMDNEGRIGNFTRIFTFLILYFTFKFSNIYLLLFFLVIAINLIYYNGKWVKWMSWRYFNTKLFLELTMALAGFYFYSQI